MDSVAFLNTGTREARSLVRAAVFGGGRAKGTLKILQELLNHGGLVAVVRAGITYLTSKCPAGAGSPFRILFHDRTLNHDASVALNDTVSCVCSSNTRSFYPDGRLPFSSPRSVISSVAKTRGSGIPTRVLSATNYFANEIFSRKKKKKKVPAFGVILIRSTSVDLNYAIRYTKVRNRDRSARLLPHRFKRVPLVKHRQI